MDAKKKFISNWKKYFGDEDLSITFFFTDERVQDQEIIAKKKGVVLCRN